MQKLPLPHGAVFLFLKNAGKHAKHCNLMRFRKPKGWVKGFWSSRGGPWRPGGAPEAPPADLTYLEGGLQICIPYVGDTDLATVHQICKVCWASLDGAAQSPRDPAGAPKSLDLPLGLAEKLVFREEYKLFRLF